MGLMDRKFKYIASLLFGTNTFNQVYMFSVSNRRMKKCGEGVKSYKDERVEDVPYSERSATSNRYSLITALNFQKQQIP